jgi:uncharacterized protein (TIGR03435 family)
MIRLYVRMKAAITGLILVASCALAQTPAPLAFEVASIKPNNAGPGHSGSDQDGLTVRLTNMSLLQCVEMAYDVQDATISAPEWMKDTRFDIIAKAPAHPPKGYLRPMLKTLLEERFKLAAHRETKVISAYALVVAKGGLKVKETGGGGQNTSTSRAKGEFNGAGATAQRLADFLALVLSAPVVDKTETTAVYDMVLKFVPPAKQGDDAAAGPSVFTALQEQLGLKLESRKLPVEVVVVDHMERVPTEN